MRTNFSNTQKTDGELSTRNLSEKAYKVYEGEEVSVIKADDKYFLRGTAFEADDLTFEEMQEMFEDYADEYYEKDWNVEFTDAMNLETTAWEKVNQIVGTLEKTTFNNLAIDWQTLLDGCEDIEPSDDGMSCEAKQNGELCVYIVHEA